MKKRRINEAKNRPVPLQVKDRITGLIARKIVADYLAKL